MHMIRRYDLSLSSSDGTRIFYIFLHLHTIHVMIKYQTMLSYVVGDIHLPNLLIK